MQNTQPRHRSKTIIRVSPKSDHAMRVLLVCLIASVLLLTYSFGRYQAALEAQSLLYPTSSAE